jgi:ParB family chromosome partitioning protein
MALIENLQREDLDAIEEATAYRRLAKDFSMKQEDIARRVGKSRAAVANAMRLLDLNHDVQDLLSSGRITIGHAKVILGVKNKEEQMLIAEKVVRKSMTVRQVEKLVSDHLSGAVGKKNVSSGSKSGGSERVAQVSAAISLLENRLRGRFATQVSINHGDKKGVITMEYYGNEDLERILELMGAGE